MLTKIISQAEISRFHKWFIRADKVVIVSHVRPDGDSIGSSLGLCHFMESQDKTVNVIVPDAFPDFLKWMPGSKSILTYAHQKEAADRMIIEADIICCLDFNSISRLNDMADAVKISSAQKIMIDHHPNPEEFCQSIISHPEVSSTSELVFRLICRMGYFSCISQKAAECIYAGMMTDTGGFTYNSNDKDIYFIISTLLTLGIDKDDIYRKVYNASSESRLRLMGHLLTTMKVYDNFRSALMTLGRNEQKTFNCMRGDSEGLVNIPLSIKSVKLSCLLHQDTEKEVIKVSLRSTGKFPCNQLAAEFFNGGGHLNASGGELLGTMDEAIREFEKALIKYESLLKVKE
ncbi:Bifunctional oligoribonuclease and PAP phosphatase NrnA [termite gut metagenome]|uniref:Bifunctional oligoribonuclease and PAP phosphatase NrnA n=1 Tax=termite gut metagenome TaxID=433724 RepID=A0A5J4SJW3_9ZZZZ